MNDLYDGRFIVVSFPSHRARDNAVRHILRREPLWLWSARRASYGYAALLPMEVRRLIRHKKEGGRLRFTILRGPYDDLYPCWPRQDKKA